MKSFNIKQIKSKSEKECLNFCWSLSDNPEYRLNISMVTHEERVQFILDNGFSYEWQVD